MVFRLTNDVRNWWGLVFFTKNSCFFTKWWSHHAVCWTPLLVLMVFGLINDVRNWWGLVFFIKNSCFLTKWWFHYAVWWTALRVVRTMRLVKVCLLVCPSQSAISCFILRCVEVWLRFIIGYRGPEGRIRCDQYFKKFFTIVFFTRRIGFSWSKVFFYKVGLKLVGVEESKSELSILKFYQYIACW